MVFSWYFSLFFNLGTLSFIEDSKPTMIEGSHRPESGAWVWRSKGQVGWCRVVGIRWWWWKLVYDAGNCKGCIEVLPHWGNYPIYRDIPGTNLGNRAVKVEALDEDSGANSVDWQGDELEGELGWGNSQKSHHMLLGKVRVWLKNHGCSSIVAAAAWSF